MSNFQITFQSLTFLLFPK